MLNVRIVVLKVLSPEQQAAEQAQQAPHAGQGEPSRGWRVGTHLKSHRGGEGWGFVEQQSAEQYSLSHRL